MSVAIITTWMNEWMNVCSPSPLQRMNAYHHHFSEWMSVRHYHFNECLFAIATSMNMCCLCSLLPLKWACIFNHLNLLDLKQVYLAMTNCRKSGTIKKKEKSIFFGKSWPCWIWSSCFVFLLYFEHQIWGLVWSEWFCGFYFAIMYVYKQKLNFCEVDSLADRGSVQNVVVRRSNTIIHYMDCCHIEMYSRST